MHVEADSVVLLVVGAVDSDGLSVDPGVELKELVRVALRSEHVGGDLGCVLVADDAQLERVAGVDSCGVCCNGSAACVMMMCVLFQYHCHCEAAIQVKMCKDYIELQ